MALLLIWMLSGSTSQDRNMFTHNFWQAPLSTLHKAGWNRNSGGLEMRWQCPHALSPSWPDTCLSFFFPLSHSLYLTFDTCLPPPPSLCFLHSLSLCLPSRPAQHILIVQRQLSVLEEDLEEFRLALRQYMQCACAQTGCLQSVTLLWSPAISPLVHL